MCAKKRDVYLLSNGQPVTEGSVSELCGVLDKPFLIPWAAKMTVQSVADNWMPNRAYDQPYIDFVLQHAKNAHRIKKDTAGDIGTEVHLIVGAYVEGQLKPSDIADERKRRSLENFIKTTKGWKWLGSEITVINEWYECRCGCRGMEVLQTHGNYCSTCNQDIKCHGYGGTADAIARIDGKVHLIDFKTSNFISPTYSMQCALYAAATPTGDGAKLAGVWREIQEARILHFNKEFLTWESLERNISEHLPYIPHFIGCRRWKKRFDQPNYSAKDDEIKVRKPLEIQEHESFSTFEF